MKRTRRLSTFNFWPCVSDLMLAAFIFVLLLWLASQARSARLATTLAAEAAAATPSPTPTPEPVPTPAPAPAVDPRLYAQSLEKELKRIKFENALLKERAPKVDLAEAKGFSFDAGTVKLSDQADRDFDRVVIEPLRKLLKQYGNYVDTIEIIGYTDVQGVAHKGSDLDAKLADAILGKTPLEKVLPGSNADLGLLRAAAMMQRLKNAQASGVLKALPIRVYSAAQVNPPDLPEPTDPKVLRRMEIRLTRVKESPADASAGTSDGH